MSEAITKKVEVTISERVTILKIFNDPSFKSNIETMACVFEDVKQLPITEEEWEKANRTQSPTTEEIEKLTDAQKETTPVNIHWDDDKVLKEVTLQEPTIAVIKAVINKRSESNDIGIADQAVLNLIKKIS